VGHLLRGDDDHFLRLRICQDAPSLMLRVKTATAVRNGPVTLAQ
jgi:hypothetical protein